MYRLNVRFYGILNDFLPRNMRYRTNLLNISTNVSIKKIIEAQGISQNDVTLITVNNIPVNSSYKVSRGDVIGIYPEFKNINMEYYIKHIQKEQKVRKFILSSKLFLLAKFLRSLGIDTICENNYTDKDILRAILLEKRVMVLGKDDFLLLNRLYELEIKERKYYFLNSEKFQKQIEEMIKTFGLNPNTNVYSYCVNCNKKIDENERRFRTVNYFEMYNSVNLCKKCNEKFSKNVFDYLN